MGKRSDEKALSDQIFGRCKRSPTNMLLLSVFLISSAVAAFEPNSIDASETSVFEPSDPTPSTTTNVTGKPKQLELTNTQVVIVCTAVAISFFIIVGEGILTCWCRRKNRRGGVPIELEHVMLPSPEDAYGAEQL
jgi:hypothetical protein